MNIQLLIVEDDADQIQSYLDIIENKNKKQDITFSPLVCKNYSEAKRALDSPTYDAAIVDLKLSQSEDIEGKKFIEDVYQKLRIPIVVYSGSISQIDDIQENSLLKKKVRTEPFKDILEYIISVYKTGLTKFLKPGGEIDSMLTKIFWDHISKDIDTWIEHSNPNTLYRYIFSHFQEYADMNEQGDFEIYHPFEVYIRPAIKKNIHTGDVVSLSGNEFVVLTPACDIVIQDYTEKKEPIRKAEFIVLGAVNKFDCNVLCKNKKGEIDKGKINEFVNNRNYRYHFLPPDLNSKTGYLIDFQNLTSFSIENVSDLNRKYSISAPFIKDVINRFSSYYARQGQPIFGQHKIVDDVSKMYLQSKNN